MTETTRDTVRRTLIVTYGPLAAATKEAFVQHMETRRGPMAAVCTLSVDEGWEESRLTTAVNQALTHISPPNLAALLAAQGWQLQDDSDINLTLLLDAQPEKAEMLTNLTQQVMTIIYDHLGLEPATLLLWLVGELAEAEITHCLRTSPATSRGTAVLSLRNESGMRLPNEADLSRKAADLLWCLTATPLQTLPEQIQARCSGSFTGDVFLFTLGLHSWAWSSVSTHATFVRRWLGDVLAYWTATEAKTASLDGAGAWLEAHQLSGAAFARHVLLPREQEPPDFMVVNSRMLWPWQLKTLWEKLQFTLTLDTEALAVYHKHAALRLADPLYEGTLTLQQDAKSMMNEMPIAAIARTCAWLQTLVNECEQQIERTLDRDETYSETTTMLVQERNSVEAKLRHWLQKWPGTDWSDWLHLGLRPWQWPRLVWLYWHIQRAMGQMGIILTQQAVLQRHIIQNKMSRQGLSELITALRRVSNQVEEVGEMFSSLSREIAKISGEPEQLFRSESPLWQMATPEVLYEQIVPDAATEAMAAATAIGGLGQQVTRLDDSVEKPLWDFGSERLAAIWQMGCAEALMALLPADVLEVQSRFAWEAASPLWRVDEARLDEGFRATTNQLTAVCGKNIQKFTNYLPDDEGSLWQIETNDPEHLWLIRVRAGLVLGE